ncbi:antibiotic biosynthesis monooxygenase [Ruminococcaceae bacterium OttesenSCG-928-L11]|nr:antibiotic biosynthesis monooxygenase [Ruminococcaceae bacterium OttesenSCG-928-L11]
MIRVVATFNLKPNQLDNALTVAKELIALTRKEEGCVHYDLAQAAQNESVLVILEAWESQEALDVHSASEHFGRLVPQLAALCVTPPAVESFTQLI